MPTLSLPTTSQGQYVLYPSGGAFNKLRRSKEQEYLNKLIDNSIDKYYNSSNRKKYIITNILTRIPGGLRAWDKTRDCSYLLDEDEAVRRVAQKIRDIKKNRVSATTLRPPSPVSSTATKCRTSLKPIVSVDNVCVTKKKNASKGFEPPKTTTDASKKRRRVMDQNSESTSLTRCPPASSRDITPTTVKDELIITLRSEIVRLRTVILGQEMELRALRSLEGIPMLETLRKTDEDVLV